ncbi:hypothetical protein A0H81_10004 [Grifola frondosa]|uniref:Uncharacterized protein n=1 Tax=Grifola frondosa TaxID=5627 RepID=A0A1C7M0C9_GRIFR|nr:hypothetical protein A0H81_10004 [Grifola frondosa]
MASSPRFTTPSRSSPAPNLSEMANEDLRSRSRASESAHAGGASPTSSSTLSHLSHPADLLPQPPIFRGVTLTPSISSHFGTPTRRVIIRADPSLVSCFDPSDKELYDLWAPKNLKSKCNSIYVHGADYSPSPNINK